MKKFISTLAKDFFNLFFPRLCGGCEKIIQDFENEICVSCQLNLPLTYFYLVKENEMWEKAQQKLPVETAVALCFFQKNSTFEQMIYNFKYIGNKKIGVVLSTLFGNCLKENRLYSDIDVVLSVPLYLKRQRDRGFNQSDVIGKKIAEILKVPFVDNYLIRQKNTPQLAKLDPSKNRFDVTFDAFSVSEKPFPYKHCLLVDDVFTTGATLFSCGNTFLKNSSARLSIATLGYRV